MCYELFESIENETDQKVRDGIGPDACMVVIQI
jgi:hypothetical protein